MPELHELPPELREFIKELVANMKKSSVDADPVLGSQTKKEIDEALKEGKAVIIRGGGEQSSSTIWRPKKGFKNIKIIEKKP